MTIFITVVTRQPEAVPAYLYGGVEIVKTYEQKAVRSSVLLLKTDNEYTAEDQRDRLNSGLHASRVHLSVADAEHFLADVFGVTA
jgi:hypothetical protein